MGDTSSIFATSQHRYHASASEKRRYGGNTVTDFIVGVKGSDASTWTWIRGYGKTPGERVTDAKRRFLAGERNTGVSGHMQDAPIRAPW